MVLGGVPSLKLDEDLFIVDKTSINVRPKRLARKQKRSIKDIKLRCFQNLEPDLKIKPAKIEHNVRKDGQKKRPLSLEKEREKNYLRLKKRQAMEQSKGAQREREEKRAKISELPCPDKDLWFDDNGNKLEGIDEYFAVVTKKKLPSRPKGMNQKPIETAAVEVPNAGASYNPAYDDYQELVGKAVEVELVKLKKEQKTERATTRLFPTRDQAPTEKTWFEEMSEGLFHEKESSESTKDEGVADEEEVFSDPRTNVQNRKQRRQRHKEMEQKKLLEAKAIEKAEKQRGNEFYRLRSLKKEIGKEQKLNEVRRQIKMEKLIQEKNKPNRIGRLKYEDPDIAVKMSTELSGSLRELKPEGDLLVDRFHSLRRRCIIEPRERHKFVRKYKKKVYEKNTHREIS